MGLKVHMFGAGSPIFGTLDARTSEVTASFGTLLGVPIVRFLVFWGPYWGPKMLGFFFEVI